MTDLNTTRGVLEANHEIRQGRAPIPTALDDGVVDMRIPKDHYRLLVIIFPELESHDHDERMAAWRALYEAAPEYRVQLRSPKQVQRQTRLGNKGIIIK